MYYFGLSTAYTLKMRLYRITSPAYASDLQATGCLYTNGRWHYKGTRVLYTSEHISLAKLEVLANSIVIPKNQVLVTIDIPKITFVKEISAIELPINWWEFPYPNYLAEITETWINEGLFWAMKVPSAQSASEYNYLLNPLHAQHITAKIINIENIHFDKRLKQE